MVHQPFPTGALSLQLLQTPPGEARHGEGEEGGGIRQRVQFIAWGMRRRL